MAYANVDLAIAIVSIGLAYISTNLHSKKRRNRNKRRWWTRSWLERREQDTGRGILGLLQNELRLEDPENYRNFLRMDENLFLKLLHCVEGKITHQNTNMRQCIPARKRLAVTLRFLATGETYKSLSFASRIAHNTLSKIIPEVLMAIMESLQYEYIRLPKDPEEWLAVADGYERQWNFPHCIGSMDGKHVTFRPPRSSGSFYRNYKGTDSIVLLALVDSNYKFMYIDVGRNGRMSDGGIYKRSNLGKAIKNDKLKLPSPKPLGNADTITPYVIVADDAFPLSHAVMKPFRYRGLSMQQKIYNYRLSRARRVVENAFGQMCNKFRILLTPINLSVEKVELITISCCLLHNFVKTERPTTDPAVDDIKCDLLGLTTQAGNRASNEALEIRQEFVNYFNGDGAVPWQRESVDTHAF